MRTATDGRTFVCMQPAVATRHLWVVVLQYGLIGANTSNFSGKVEYQRLATQFKNYAVLCLVAQSHPTLCDPMDCSPPGSSVHGDSPGKNPEVSCHALLQGILPTQESNWGLLPCRQILYQLSCQGRLYIEAKPACGIDSALSLPV